MSDVSDYDRYMDKLIDLIERGNEMMDHEHLAELNLDLARNYDSNHLENQEYHIKRALVHAVMHLADMQRERNKLAALTAKHRGLDMAGLEHLLEDK